MQVKVINHLIWSGEFETLNASRLMTKKCDMYLWCDVKTVSRASMSEKTGMIVHFVIKEWTCIYNLRLGATSDLIFSDLS